MNAFRTSRFARLVVAVVAVVFLAAFSLGSVLAQQSNSQILVERAGDVIVVNTQNGAEVNLTHALRVQFDKSQTPTRIAVQPRWNLDGSLVALTYIDPNDAPKPGELAHGDIWVVNADGGLVIDWQLCHQLTINCAAPYLSQGGRWLVVSTVRLTDNHSTLWVVDLLTGKQEIVKDGGFNPADLMGFRMGEDYTFVLVGKNVKHVFDLYGGSSRDEPYTAPTAATNAPATIIVSCNNELAVQNGENISLIINGTQTGTITGSLPVYPGFTSAFSCARVATPAGAATAAATTIIVTATPMVFGPAATAVGTPVPVPTL